MCTYTFTLDDKLVEQVRPAFRDNNAIQEWLQSQMELFVRQYVKKIVQKKKAEDDIAERISQLSNLLDDWDGYGAPAISKKAIDNAKTALKDLPTDVYLAMDILPTEYGGVQMKVNKDKLTELFGKDICCV